MELESRSQGEEDTGQGRGQVELASDPELKRCAGCNTIFKPTTNSSATTTGGTGDGNEPSNQQPPTTITSPSDTVSALKQLFHGDEIVTNVQPVLCPECAAQLFNINQLVNAFKGRLLESHQVKVSPSPSTTTTTKVKVTSKRPDSKTKRKSDSDPRRRDVKVKSGGRALKVNRSLHSGRVKNLAALSRTLAKRTLRVVLGPRPNKSRSKVKIKHTGRQNIRKSKNQAQSPPSILGLTADEVEEDGTRIENREPSHSRKQLSAASRPKSARIQASRAKVKAENISDEGEDYADQYLEPSWGESDTEEDNTPITKVSQRSRSSKPRILKRSRSTKESPNKKEKVNRPPSICEICSREFQHPQFLIQHMRSHNKSYPCRKCKEKFPSKDDLDAHKTEDHPLSTTSFQITKCCQICPLVFKNSQLLAAHMKEDHEQEKTFKCAVEGCGKGFMHVRTFQLHQNTHNFNKTCPVCNRSFTSETFFDAHKAKHAKEKLALPFECPTCLLRYSKQSTLAQHIRYMHINRSAHQCAQCGKAFGDESRLRQHEISHQSVGTELCTLCGRLYKHKKDLNLHIRKVHGAGAPLVRTFRKIPTSSTCPIPTCKKQFDTAHLLRVHQAREKHYPEGEEPPEDPSTFDPTNWDVLTDHFAVGDGSEKFQCHVCLKTFSTEVGCLSHQLIHAEKDENERHFECGECNTRFTTLDKLERHARAVHPRTNVYPCDTCGKIFGKPSLLKRHALSHDSTVSHPCQEPGCRKEYKHETDLRKHFMNHHSGLPKPHKCVACNREFFRGHQLRLHKIIAHPEEVILPVGPPMEETDTETKIEEGDEIIIITTQ